MHSPPQITLRSSGVNKILPLRGNGQNTACRRHVTRRQAQLTPHKRSAVWGMQQPTPLRVSKTRYMSSLTPHQHLTTPLSAPYYPSNQFGCHPSLRHSILLFLHELVDYIQVTVKVYFSQCNIQECKKVFISIQ